MKIFNTINDDKISQNYLYFLATAHSFFRNRNFLKHFGFIYFLYFIAFFKFITSDTLHLDDQSRFLYSYSDFSLGNRYLSEFLSHIFHTSYPKILYISPITQLIAIAFLSLASMALVKIVNKKITYFGLIASLCVGLSPFYLECMLFKFDSPYMALATLCAILPFLFIRKLSLFFITSIIFLLYMWNLYQANNGIYIVLSMFVVLNLILQKADLKQICKFIFISTFAFAISILIYKFIMSLGVRNSYADTNISQIINSFEDFKWMIDRFVYLINIWIGTHIIKELFFISCILFLISKFLESKKNAISTIFFGILFLFFGFFATFGLYYILSNLNWLPRFFCGIGVFTAILLINSVNIKVRILTPCIKIFTLIFAYNLIVISTVFINAKIIQSEYIDYRINQTYSFIENNFQDKSYNIQISGENLYSTPRKERISINNNVGFHQTVFDMINYIPLSGNSAAGLADFFNTTHRNKNIMPIRCIPQNEKPIKIINTRLNKFEVYKNNCIVITYKKMGVKKLDIKFENNMLKYKELMFKANLVDDLTLFISKDMRKKDYGIYGLIFEFNQNIRKFADKDDTTLSFELTIKDIGNITINKEFDEFKKINNKFYYITALSNANLNDIENIRISFYNKNENKFTQRFLLDMKDLLSK